MELPFVTVVTPSFNRASFISGAIASLAKQSYRRFEHFVIDGGSKDGTRELLAAEAERGTLKFVSEPDQGMYDAVNKGLARSNGDILAYLNTDDRYWPWTIETAAGYLAEHPEVDAVYGDTLVYDQTNDSYTPNILPGYDRHWLQCGGIIPQPTVFFRRRVYEAIGGFQQSVRYLADCEYWLRMNAEGMQLSKLNEIMALEINHGDTIRQTLAEAVEAEKRQLVQRYGGRYWGALPVRRALLRAKYLEKEYRTLRFASVHRAGTGDWKQFGSVYSLELDLAGYFASKLTRETKTLWKMRRCDG